MGLIGCSALKNKRHWDLRWGQCAHCGVAGYCTSYDATRTMTVFGLPVLPLGRVHVHDACGACQKAQTHSAEEWEALREKLLYPAIQNHASNPDNPTAASALLEQLSHYGDHEEFETFATDIRSANQTSALVLNQLAWCHGRFGDFETARQVYAESLALAEDQAVRQAAAAYAALPDTREPQPPGRLGQLVPFFVMPMLLLIVGAAAFLAVTLDDTITHAYVINGLATPYSVLINDVTVDVPAHGRRRMTLAPGSVSVQPSPETAQVLSFTPYRFVLTPGSGTHEPTVIINPDQAAVLSWEELVYQPTADRESDGLADQYAFHTGDPYYVFLGVTDHFVDPPDTLELRSKSKATFRYLVKMLDQASPVEVASILLSYGEMELGAVYARNLLTHRPDDFKVLGLLTDIAPNKETLNFIKPRLEARPVWLPWHLAHQALEAQLKPEVDQQAYYEKLLAEEPDNQPILHMLGLVTEDPEQARRYWERAAEKPQPVVHALQALAERAANEANFEVALEYAARARREIPASPVFVEMEESYLIAQQRYQKLIPRYIDRVRQQPLDQALAMMLAGLYAAAGAGQDADAIIEGFVRTALENDPSLDEGSLQGLRLVFHSEMARWRGDPDEFVEMTGQLPEGQWTLTALLLTGELDMASQLIGETKDDPFLFLTLYALTLANGKPASVAEEYLSTAIKALEADSTWRRVIVPWFRFGAPPPTLQDTLKVRLVNADRRVLLTALGLRHPELREPCFALARKLNHDRSFPFLVLHRILNR